MDHKRVPDHLILVGRIVLAGMLVLVASVTPTAWGATVVFINEIHYDNSGADKGEAIEIAGPAGTDLNGWRIILYNGTNGASYGTEMLSGALPDQCGGYGTLVVAVNSVQNGGPDGIALVDSNDNVIQFLSYEGTFAATGGPASGLTSTDIGVVEDGDTPAGHSLQLGGTGSVAEDFSWNSAQPNTFGACNMDQTFNIDEIDTAPSITSTSPADGDSNVMAGTNLEISFSEDIVPAEGWFEISCSTSGFHAAAASGGPRSYTLDPDTDFAAGESCTLTINKELVSDVDAQDPPDTLLADKSVSFDTAGLTVRADLIINEIDYDQPGSDTAEFVELMNPGQNDISLAAYVLELVNGNGGTPYQSIDLPDIALGPGDYFVICNDATAVLNCDLVAINSIQNGAPDAVALTLAGTIIDTVSYEGDTISPYTEGTGHGLEDPDATGQDNKGLARFPNGVDTNQNSVDLSVRCATPGAANGPEAEDCTVPAPNCGNPATFIHEIQGSGPDSPLRDQPQIVEGIVVGDFQGDTGLGGFFLQEEDTDHDLDPATSEGIFVADGPTGAPVETGDLVRVEGDVAEIFGLTSLTNLTGLTVCAGDSTSVAATILNLPLLDQAEYERYEGMLVTAPGELSLTDSFYLHRFGEVVLSVRGKQFTPTNLRLPGPDASDLNENRVADSNEPGRLILDDGSLAEYPVPLPYLGPGNTLRLGDTVTDLTGVLSFGFGNYRLQPTESIEFFRANPRPEPPNVGGGLKVAAFNLQNYWTTIDDGTNEARGADSPAEFNRQRAKSVAALLELDADVVGLQELENNGPAAVSNLVDALNEATAPDTWRFVPAPDYPGGLETTDAIKVGLIYKIGRLTPIGDPVADDDPIFGSDRPPLAQTFEVNGELFSLVVNHFKSKNCDGASGLDLDQNDGQGCYNARRTLQAKALLNFIARLQETTKDEDVLVIGDFNAYAQEDPIAVLNSGLTNLLSDLVPQQDQYSYAYFGQLGLLDYAFATSRLASRVKGVGIWHINADEPRALSYNDEIVDPSEDNGDLEPELLFKADQFRSSDHDPVVVGLDLKPSPAVVYISSRLPGHLGGVEFGNEDILAYDTGTGQWTLHFDGSDVGLDRVNVDAFHLLDNNSLLLSLNRPKRIDGLGWVDDSDILKFVPSTLGENTTGSFERFLNGAEVELTSHGEDIDAIGLSPGGQLIVSTAGFFSVSGLRGRDEDLIVLNEPGPDSAAPTAWSTFLNGSDVDLRFFTEDIWGTWIDDITGEIFLTTLGRHSVSGLHGSGSDVIVCLPRLLGPDSSCDFREYWHSPVKGTIDGLHIGR